MATFKKTCAFTSRKYLSEPRTIIPSLWEKFQFSWSHSSVFADEKEHKNLKFLEFFTCKRRFGGYFQWIACTYFLKICRLTKYSNAKLIKNISNFLVALLRFCFRKTTLKSIFHNFLSLKESSVATFKKTCAFTSRKYLSEPRMIIPNLWEKFQFSWSHSSFFADEKEHKNLKFLEFFLPVRDALVATFNESRAPTSWKYVG